MSKEYKLLYPDGEYRGIDVVVFKHRTEQYVRERLDEKEGFRCIFIKQRCYRDGRWEFRLYTPWFPSYPQFSKKYKMFWDDPDIAGRLDYIIMEYNSWISSVE